MALRYVGGEKNTNVNQEVDKKIISFLASDAQTPLMPHRL